MLPCMTKPVEQNQARELRRRGKSMKAIARELGVSLGSVHLWTKDIPLDPESRARLAENGHQKSLLRARVALGEQRLSIVLADRDEADVEWPLRKLDPEFTYGLALYIGEGHKTSSTVGMTNADPAVLRAALKFFKLIGVDIDRVRVSIILHRGESPNAALRYWSEELLLPPSQFHKVTPSKVSGGKRARHLIHGTANVRLSAFRVKRKLNRWMELARAEFGPK